MQVSNSATVRVLPSANDAEGRIEIVIEPHEGGERILLRYSTWIDELGWCSQKTIRLDDSQLDDLSRALIVARQRLKRQRAEADQTAGPARVIQLPIVA